MPFQIASLRWHAQRLWITPVLAAAAFALPSAAHADIFEKGDEISVQTNLFLHHYSKNPDHVSFSPLIGVEWRRDSGWLYGGALFRNSFGQFSQTAYVGHLWNLGDTGLYAKVVGGVMHGYKGKFANKVPFNKALGFGIAGYPALGYRVGKAQFELQFFGTAAVMLTGGMAFK